MELLFLGTSAGTPTKSRNVTGLALRKVDAKPWILVDCGEATQHRILRAPISLHRLQAICITHLHGDHCYGLPGLLASASLMGRTAPLTIIGPKELPEWVRITLQLTQVTLGYELDFIDVASLTAPVALDDFLVSTIPLSHRVACFAYQFVETYVLRKLDKAKLLADGIESGEVWGQLLRGETATFPDGRIINSESSREAYLLPTRPPHTVIIAGDNDNPALLAHSAQSAQLLVHEATYTQDIADKVGAEAQHSSAKMIAEFAQAVALPNLILTHFSPRYRNGGKGHTIHEIEQEARQHYGGTLFLAQDLALYYLDNSGKLSKRDARG
ncbi:MBL fold metallo-hydrolase [Oceanisphaera profunda]|uniref:Ribonuclease Z n=1 Tax=Oceanisphaera profunda TaxID=1416627 RepID=A0A1Y0D878_9GAMM|nr:ribonuclease Z [Oceanisphaera profunda]ART83752.1 MBL fold metallo-hydrolase [Oceanisphaera profunda]